MDQYRTTLDYLYRQLPMYQLIGVKAFKKDLTNIIALLDFLGQPQVNFNSIHIAGTNGKGSTAHALSAILQAHGYKVGLYTSPHYRDFRERIKVNGQYIPRREVVRFVEAYRHLFEPIQPSFFELTVAMAFEYFARVGVEVAVVETGLGGRLDSTNVVMPLLSIITNISFDHQAILGDTLPLIAGEKAGIIKRNVPVVIGETHGETAPVFLNKAREEEAPIIFADQHYEAKMMGWNWQAAVYEIHKDGQVALADLQTDLNGPYQARNLQTVLQSVELLSERLSLHDNGVRQGLASVRGLTRFMGRWQVLGQAPLVLCDSAHNEGGIRYVTANLAQIPHRSLHVVLGMVNDKDPDKILSLFPPNATYYFARPDLPRGLDAAQLQKKAATYGLQGRTYASVRHALRAARRRALPEDLIFVGGSTFVVAEVVTPW